MKKKAIEKIPYLKPEWKDPEAKFVAVTAFKNVDHERHLIIDVYKNGENRINPPAVRIVLTKKDFGNYFPETQEWTRQQVMQGAYYGQQSLNWGESIRNWNTSEQEKTKKRNVLSSEADRKRIETMCGSNRYRSEWWELIKSHEEGILSREQSNRREKRWQRRQQALKDRMDHTRPLPEASILDKANRIYMSNSHYLYYKKHGCHVQIACSACGGVTDARFKSGISYESQFEHCVETPQEGRHGRCHLCKAQGEYRCQGKVKSSFSKSISLFLGQKYKESGLVMRNIEVTKTWTLELMAGDRDTDMIGAKEELAAVEKARAYFEPEKEVQIDYHKHNPYLGTDFWDDCNLSGMGYINIPGGWILSETWDEIAKTAYKYSAMREFAQRNHNLNPIEYLKHYSHTPQIEMLVKMGLDGAVNSIIDCRYGVVQDVKANRIDTFLGIQKERIRQLKEKNGNLEFLRVCQMEKRMNAKWTDEQIEQIAGIGLSQEQISRATKYMSIQQLLNRIQKYTGRKYIPMCRHVNECLNNIATYYLDYLSMREKLGYDLSNTVYQQPRDLGKAHDKMVAELNQKKQDERLKEVKEKFPKIRKNYRKLRKEFLYEDNNYIIRPARSAEEIVMEGRILHHCVGGDTYLDKHNEGKSYILLLRFKKDPEIPYITVEITPEYKILQWYGAHDKKPDEENMRMWLNSYVTRLRCGDLAAGMKASADVASQQVLQFAV